MKILFLSHYFPPEVNAPATRGYEHCRAWVNAGHDVTVVTCAPNHPFGDVYTGYDNKYTEEHKDGIKIIRIKTYISPNEGFTKRTAAYVSFMLSAIAHVRRYGKHDVVLTTSPQFFNGLAGFFVSRLKRIPWALEIRDLWPDSILAVGAMKNQFIINMLYAIENFAYKRCNHIIAVTDSFKEYMTQLGVPASKISVIKNGVDLDFFDSHEKLCKQSVELEGVDVEVLRNKFVASYVGTHGMAHHLQTVLKTAFELRDRKDIHFLLIGDGAERRNLIKMRDEMGLSNVTMLEQRPKSDMPIIWSLTDASIVHLRRDDVFKSVIPSKIFESMAMEKPIVMGVEGESAAMIRDAGSGLTIEPESIEAMKEAIVTLADSPSLAQEMGANGREYVEARFDRNVLAKRYERLLQRVIDSDDDYGSGVEIEISVSDDRDVLTSH